MESPEYDTPSYRAEVTSWFERLNLEWRWVPVTLETLDSVVKEARRRHQTKDGVVFNLCDGDEIHGYPGLSVVRMLEQAGLPFTGAASAFYEATTFKVRMKELFLKSGVPTSPFVVIRKVPEDLDRLSEELGFPAIIKPDVSAASVGISLRSVVHDVESAGAQVCRLTQEETARRGVAAGLFFAERFVDGPEFTVLLVADREQTRGVRVYPAAERVFYPALPAHERLLSYDRYWAEYKEESRLPGGAPLYRYALAAPALQAKLADVATRAFRAVGGTGYARVDIRMAAQTGEPYVLEVNSNCGMSGDMETSVGDILHLTRSSIDELISLILRDAFDRARPDREKQWK